MHAVRSNSSVVDIKLIVLLTVFYTVFEFIHLIKIFYYLDQNNLLWPDHFEGIIFIDWFLVISFMIFMAFSVKKLIIKNVSWTKIFLIHFFLAILISFIIRFAADFYFMWREDIPFKEFNSEKFRTGIMSNLDINFVIYFAMLLIIYSYYYFQEIRRNEVQSEMLKSQLLSTKIQMLTTQLQPHFLFNVLNGISSLIEIDKKQAQDMVADLGDFLREILYHSNSNFTTVQKELNFLQKYFNLLHTRYWERLIIEQNVHNSILNAEIPAMIMQPIIENATKHGFRADIFHLKIIISIYPKGEWLFIKIDNTGKMMDDKLLTLNKGVGLSNLEERLKNIYGSNYHVSIENCENENGVSCCIKIPLKE